MAAAAPAVEGQPVVAAPEAPAAPAPSWRTSYEDADVKGSTSLDKFKGANEREILGSVAKAYVNLEKMPRGVTAPKDDAPKAEWDAFYEKLGRPKTVDEYGIEMKVPEGMPWNKDAEKSMLARAHAVGLTKRQAETLLNGYLEDAARGNTLMQQNLANSRHEAEKTMNAEWGGLASQNTSLVQRSVGEFGGDEFRQYLDETGLGNDPRFMRFVYNMARPMMEDGLIKGENLGMKRADAQAEIDRLMKDPGWAKGDKTVLARINDLFPIAHGE